MPGVRWGGEACSDVDDETMGGDVMLTAGDEKRLVRDLAARIAEAARSERMRRIHARWCDVNSGRKPDRAPVWCKPVGCWPELLPEESLQCSTPLYRNMEQGLRRDLIKLEIDDDTPLEPWWGVRAAFRKNQEYTWGIEIQKHRSGEKGGAWSYAPALRDDDFDKLVQPQFHFDAEATERRRAQMEEILDGIMPVRVQGGMPLGATLGTPAADLRGLEGIMMDMIDEPALMHRLMGFLRDSVLAAMDVVEAAGQVTPNHYGPMTKSDPLGSGQGGWKDCWCSANSQEFDQVSPAMWEEFCLAYQMPIFERFGAVAYGCCENLTQKAGGVLSIPNLRIFVCSAWTDLDAIVDRVGTDHTIMWRQKASDVVFARDDAVIREHFERNLPKLQGLQYQIVMRELETLRGDSRRLHRWSAIAKECAARFA